MLIIFKYFFKPFLLGASRKLIKTRTNFRILRDNIFFFTQQLQTSRIVYSVLDVSLIFSKYKIVTRI